MRQDAFDLLGLAAHFDIDPARVEQAYLERAARTHPDALVPPHPGAAGQAGLSEDHDAPQAAARLNAARQDLLDPERRARLLLNRLGAPLAETDKSLPDGFLNEMMGINLTLEDAIETQDDQTVRELLAWAESRHAQSLRSLAAKFDSIQPGGPPEALGAIRVELNALRYVVRLLERLHGAPASGDSHPRR